MWAFCCLLRVHKGGVLGQINVACNVWGGERVTFWWGPLRHQIVNSVLYKGVHKLTCWSLVIPPKPRTLSTNFRGSLFFIIIFFGGQKLGKPKVLGMGHIGCGVYTLRKGQSVKLIHARRVTSESCDPFLWQEAIGFYTMRRRGTCNGGLHPPPSTQIIYLLFIFSWRFSMTKMRVNYKYIYIFSFYSQLLCVLFVISRLIVWIE
jgi:hypothetical protein